MLNILKKQTGNYVFGLEKSIKSGLPIG